MNTIQELYKKARRLLRKVAAPTLEAKVLLLKATGLSEEKFFASPDRPLSRREENRFNRLLNSRLSGLPFAYVTGEREFWSLPLKIKRGVFIPRPETELIVERTIALSSKRKETIVDIGTGSGNIALALAKELPRAQIVATDISVAALRTAGLNAQLLDAPQISLAHGNLFSPLAELGLEQKCDFIVCNPPYVSAADWEILPPPIKKHEPRRALVPGKTGLEFIRRLIRGAPDYLKPGGCLLFEVGQGQAEKTLSLFDSRWDEVEAFADLSGIPRVIKARRVQAFSLAKSTE